MLINADPSFRLEDVARALEPFGVELAEFQLKAIRHYMRMLTLWNQSFSLTAVEDPIEVVARHFGESIFGATAIGMHSGRLADVGSGAGFPGFPIKIANTGILLDLIESNQKKCAFLREICGALDVTDVAVRNVRYEDLTGTRQYDFICSRAVGGYKRILKWSSSALTPVGRVALWLGIEDCNLLMRAPGWRWELPVKIPESRGRVILAGRPPSG